MYSKKIFCIENNQYNWKNEKKYNALPVTVENSQIKNNFLQLQLPFSSFQLILTKHVIRISILFLTEYRFCMDMTYLNLTIMKNLIYDY